MLQQDQERQEIFVGRGYELEQYNDFLRGEEAYWMLLFIGIPGIGKTTLLHQLAANTPDDVGIISLNFHDTDPYPDLLTDPLQVLEALAVRARDFCDQKKYHEFMNTLQKGHEQLKQSKEQKSKEVEQLTEQRSDPQELAQFKQELLSDEQKSVRGIVTRAFYDQIITFEKMRLVLLFDTCEFLNEPEGWEVGKWLLGEFLPRLHDRMDQLDRKCFVVIASRVLLEFDVIQGQDQQCFELKMLKGPEVNEYLEQAGIGTEGENAILSKEGIYRITQGHPLTLSIIRELWDAEDENQSSDEDKDIAAFQSKFDDKVSTEFVEQRILNRLDFPFRDLTQFGVILRSFNLPQLKTLFPKLLPEPEASDVFKHFTDYPYIESKGGYRYTFHEFIREVLAKHTREKHPKEWVDYHEAAQTAFTVPDSPEWYYHLIGADEMKGMQLWKEAIQLARITRNGQAVGALLQVAEDKALNLTLTSQASLTEEEELFYQDSGRPDKAAESCRQAEQFKQEIEHFKEKAKALQRQGDEQRHSGDLDAAVASYKEALKLFQHVGNYPEDEARLRKAINEVEQILTAPPTAPKAVTSEEMVKVPVSFFQKRSVLAAVFSVLILVLVFVLIFLSIFHGSPPAPFHTQLPLGIGVSQTSNGELIGISNGAFAFDADCRTTSPLKCQAADKLRQGDINGAASLWNRALAVNTNDAEALIYLEDQRVQNSPHVTLVVATTLTGSSVNLGRDNLQGAYVAQKEFNDGFKLPNGLKVVLLIANFGSDPRNATMVAKQIVQAAQADKTIVGVMGLPLSSYVPDAIAILQQAHLPLVSSGASSDALTGISPSFFRVVPPDEFQARVGADYAIHTLHAHTVALFYDPKDSSSKSLAKDFARLFTDLGGFVREKTYAAGQPEMLRLQLKDILKNPPSLLYFAGSATDMNTIFINLPPSSNLQIMGGDSLYQPQDYSTASGTRLTQLHFTAFAYPDEWDILCHNGLSPACSKPSFFTVYPQAFDDGKHQKHPYGYSRANSSTIVSYDALSVLLTAYQRALSQGQDLQVALKTITGTQAFQGVSGQISFGAGGNPLNKVVVILSVDPHGDVKLASSKGIQGCFLINQCRNP